MADGGLLLAVEPEPSLFADLVNGQAEAWWSGGIDPSVESDAVFGAYVAMMAEDYAAMSPTPDGFDAFLGGVAAMWGTEKPGGRRASRRPAALRSAMPGRSATLSSPKCSRKTCVVP